jgi:hypothetical protein
MGGQDPGTKLKLSSPADLEPRLRAFYRRAMDTLQAANIRFLVGGAYAMAVHAGIIRHTKDFDIFVMHTDAQRALKTLADAGYRTDLTFPHWLGKAFEGDGFVDVIYGSGNGLCPVDEEWMDNGVDGEVLGKNVKLVPAEEVLWTKSFIQERERFDGGDVNHLILARGQIMDWQRLIRRFANGHERVLLAHLLLFEFAYPSERNRIPPWVIDELLAARKSDKPTQEKLCRGTFLSREQYLTDILERGFLDARLAPRGPMKKADVDHWTAAIGTIR